MFYQLKEIGPNAPAVLKDWRAECLDWLKNNLLGPRRHDAHVSRLKALGETGQAGVALVQIGALHVDGETRKKSVAILGPLPHPTLQDELQRRSGAPSVIVLKRR